MNQDVYWEWQNYFRARWPKKPLLFDIAWAIYRDSASYLLAEPGGGLFGPVLARRGLAMR